jgi:hypothetical protein
MRGVRCVVSAAEHAGWAHVICVAATGNVPVVIERRRVALIDPELPTMPYHHESLAMTENEANALIARVRESIAARTSVALELLASDLAPAYAVAALAIRESPFAELPESVADVRASYRLQCAADGMLYQIALCRAAQQLDVDVRVFRRGEESSRAAAQLDVTTGEIDEFITRTGRPSGPPWTQDHRRAYAAGIAALASHVRQPLKIPKRFQAR